MSKVIDDMPTLTQVEQADDYQVVCWHLFLRPTFTNDELPIVKLIRTRYDNMSPALRESYTNKARVEHA